MKTMAIGLAAFLLGGGVGYAVFGTASEKPRAAECVAAPKDDGALGAAKKRIAELESELAKCRAPKPASAEKAEKDGQAKEFVINSGEDIRETLKKNLSPAEFAQATNAFERLKASRQKRTQGKMDFLASIDTSRWSEDEKRSHAEFAKLIARQQEISAKMKGGIPDPSSIQELVNLQLKMKPLADAERKVLLRQFSNDIGYTGEDAAVITDTIGDIIGLTSSGGLGDLVGEMSEDLGGADGEPKVEIQTQVMAL